MSRKWLLASLAGSAALAAGLFFVLSNHPQAKAEPQPGQGDQPSVKTTQLPIGPLMPL